jgi:hypothetical protein
MQETFDETVQRLKGELPLPSECQSQFIEVPYLDPKEAGYGRITFEREYHEGICIGWTISQGFNLKRS